MRKTETGCELPVSLTWAARGNSYGELCCSIGRIVQQILRYADPKLNSALEDSTKLIGIAFDPLDDCQQREVDSAACRHFAVVVFGSPPQHYSKTHQHAAVITSHHFSVSHNVTIPTFTLSLTLSPSPFPPPSSFSPLHLSTCASQSSAASTAPSPSCALRAPPARGPGPAMRCRDFQAVRNSLDLSNLACPAKYRRHGTFCSVLRPRPRGARTRSSWAVTTRPRIT